MKIVSGKYGGRRLQVPKNYDIRPTSDKIRGAIFNMLQSRGAVEHAYVLDAFCGTGALGLESLSRGAEFCTFLDKARNSLSLAQENAKLLGAEVDSNFNLKDAMKYDARTGEEKQYDLIFLDPPYKQDLITSTLGKLISGDWVSDQCWIVCESEKSFSLAIPAGFTQDEEKIYGDTKVILLKADSV